MLADIATGNTGTADVLFLIAAIVFGLAALSALTTIQVSAGMKAALVPVGLTLVAIAWLIL